MVYTSCKVFENGGVCGGGAVPDVHMVDDARCDTRIVIRW